MIGRTLSHYQIVERIAAGGMGVVYRARDLRLKRDVALKVLPTETLADEGSRRRFRREALTLSQLSHPNIGTIFDFDSADGIDFLVMELVGGAWLEDRIRDGPWAERDILAIAIPIVEALHAAHQRGVIHRDLKPANIGFTTDGHVKVLDFGLARLLRPISEDTTTETSVDVNEVAGTIPYMAPEQLLARPLDGRVDVYAMGVILYRMASGRLPFQETNRTALSNAILHQSPTPPMQLARVSMRFQEIVLRCLEKDPAHRYQTAGDLKADLNRCVHGHDSSVVEGPLVSGARSASRNPALWIVLAATLLLAYAIVSSRKPAAPTVPLHRQLTFVGSVADQALAPDGKSFAYVDRRPEGDRLMVQDIGAGRALEIFSADVCLNLRWSPDGSSVLCLGPKGNVLRTCVVPRLGGSARSYPVFGIAHAWAPDGARFVTVSQNDRTLSVTQTESGRTTTAALGAEFPSPSDIDWSPRESLLVVATVDPDGTNALWTVTPSGSHRRRILVEHVPIESPRWSTSGDAIYYLRVQPSTVDLCRLRVSSHSETPTVLMSGIESSSSFSPSEPPTSISFSRDGLTMLYAREAVYSNLWRFERTPGDPAGAARETQLTTGTGFNGSPCLSPDERLVGFVKGDRAPSNIWTVPLAGGEPEQVTFMGSQSVFPCWSSSGDEIAFLSNEGGPWRIWKVGNRGGPPQVFDRSRPLQPPNLPAWSPGPGIVYPGPTQKTLAVLDPRSGVERTLAVDDSAALILPRWSPDGERLALLRWKDADHASVRILSTADKHYRSICDSALMVAGWSRDGRWVYAWNHLDSEERILALPAGGGPPRVMMRIRGGRQMGIPVVTGDGTKAVAPVVVRQRDVWLAENFQRAPR